MQSNSKQRSPSQCREWERQRRNKFNDAVSRLGDIVKAIYKASESNDKGNDASKDIDNVKYPKIEIVQKAIMCLTNLLQETTQLKTEILALQVKLESVNKNKPESKRDVSTQVYLEVSRKSKNGKFTKVLMMQKSKSVNHKEPCIINKPVDTVKKTEMSKLDVKQSAITQKLPNILPRCNIMNKKGQENAIVVLPAAPYIFPQRPLLLPSLPPAIVLVDSNLQNFSKPVPIVSRNNGDVTKTTMVNILPISAYSRPLSASKHKKTNIKIKDTNKKIVKKKRVTEKLKETTKDVSKDINEISASKENISELIENKENEKETSNTENETIFAKSPQTKNVATNQPEIIISEKENIKTNNNVSTKSEAKANSTPNTDTKSQNPEKPQSANPIANKDVSVETLTLPQATATEVNDTTKSSDNSKVCKTVIEKSVVADVKERESKIPNILDTALCDSAVDGGNARLELAEEFLAASPTAAFLMSFPLVSGNRADSPVEEPQNTISNPKDNSTQRRDLIPQHTTASTSYFEKPNPVETKPKINKPVSSTSDNKPSEPQKYSENVPKSVEAKVSTAVTLSCVSNDNPFLNLPMPSIITTNCTLSDTTFGLDFDCNLNKPTTNQSTYVSNGNIFYKNDPFSTVKSTIYSTSSITSNHDFNGLGLYPCAMEKYTSSKNKADYSNVDENNVMKIGSSRLTYDIDLGWSHKGFDFVNCTSTTNTFSKDNILTTVATSTPFSTSYNPFNPEFHVPLVANTNKKDNVGTKPNTSFSETISNFYSQAPSLWTDEPFYTNTNVPKSLGVKHQTYLPLENVHTNNVKQNITKQYVAKENTDVNIDSNVKTNNTVGQQMNEKYTKKSPSKMHINWMTSEIRPMQTNYNTTHTEVKEPHKLPYNHLNHTTKRQDHSETNTYFPISMHNFTTQPPQEEFQVWPSARPLGTTEISIDPPPINLPTLVGDLALGPHEKKKNIDATNRALPQQDLQNCNNFFSVTQLMNRSSDNLSSRYHSSQIETTKSIATKQNIPHYPNDSHRKAMTSRVDNHLPQPYVFNDPKLSHNYENMPQFSQVKTKSSSKSDKNPKSQKNNYSAEALLRGGSCTQKLQDNKFLMPPQKYNDFNTTQDSGVAQVSHFPPILDYSENSYAGQQFSGTSLYNTTTNTLSNSFYSNFMPGSTNLMSTNYPSGPFTGEFIDYNQAAECNYTNHKYEELKMRNNPPPVFQTEKVPSNYKSSRRDSAAKHKLECSKKESSKKYQSKRVKLNEVEEWSDPSHALWQSKPAGKRHPNLMADEIPFPNYVGNQVPQYQAELFNSHLAPANMQAAPHNADRSLASFPITSRANFNLSTIFPEITMKVQ